LSCYSDLPSNIVLHVISLRYFDAAMFKQCLQLYILSALITSENLTFFCCFLIQYYDDTYPTPKEQKAFEKSLFTKTHRANGMYCSLVCYI